VLRALLREMGLGEKIHAASNEDLALSLAKQLAPDLILTAWQMQSTDGYKWIKALKASEETKRIPVIMITGVKTDPISMKASFDAGVHDYICKPYDKLEFFARIGASLKLQDALLTISRQQDELLRQGTFKDRLLTAISHDLRSPLVSLEGLLRVFNDEGIYLSSQELIGYTATIQGEVGNTLSLMDSLLFWAKTQMEDHKLALSFFELRTCVDEVGMLLTHKISEKNIHLINEIPPFTSIKSNKYIIAFIIRNLLDNAVKFSAGSGKVRITFQDSAAYNEIQIMDSGKGMDPQYINDFFSNTSTESQGKIFGEMGMGLGLKLCKDFASQIKASLFVSSEKGKGSIFSLRLPK
jgi:signal transduction histidine kinase